MFPSTRATATVAGFVAGGSGGVGSITWGGLRDFGNVLRLRVLTMEAEPRALELTGRDLHKAVHAYGTNGIITEVEMPLTATYDWVEAIIGFDSFDAAAAYGLALGEQDGILKKLVTIVAAPAPQDYFLRHRSLIPAGKSVVLAMVAPHALNSFEAFTRPFRSADILFVSSRASPETLKGLPPIYELTWNHTTLRALRVDPTITYLQVRYFEDDLLGTVRRIHERFAPEIIGHLEVIRFNGRVGFAGLPLVRFTHRGAIAGDHRRARGDGGDNIQSPPLYARGRRHEADGFHSARLQARNGPAGPPQSRQDDRLRGSQLRFLGREELPLPRPRSPRPRRAELSAMRVLVPFGDPPRPAHRAIRRA